MHNLSSGHPEPEAPSHDWVDDHDGVDHLEEHDSKHVLDVYANVAQPTEQGIDLHYTSPFDNREHTVRLDWETVAANGWAEISRHPQTGRELGNTVVRILPPQGTKDAWEQGRINIGGSYPEPFTVIDPDRKPAAYGDCPVGCVKDHARDNHTAEHYSIVRTNIIEPANLETSRLMVRTQQFMDNSDPSDVLRWINIQFHDLDLGRWQALDLSVDQAHLLAGYLTFMVEGANTLQSIVPAGVRYQSTAANHAESIRAEGD